jgi:hypothetical protein
MVLVPSVVRAAGAGGQARAREILAGVSGWLLMASGRLADVALLALGAAGALGAYVLVLRAVTRRISSAPKAA